MDTENSQPFGTLPQSSEPFGTVPQPAEPFGTLPHISERRENHIFTVRQVARMFDDAGVPRTERSITNWCRRDASGVSRLDAFFDFNERRYFITPESVERAIAEEKAKATPDGLPNVSETTPPPASSFPHVSAEVRHTSDRGGETGSSDARMKELEKELMDLKILNAGKDFFIKQLQEDREHLKEEHKDMVSKLVDHSRQLGQLETRLLQIESPRPHATPSPQSVEFTQLHELDDTNPASLN